MYLVKLLIEGCVEAEGQSSQQHLWGKTTGDLKVIIIQ